MTDNLRDRIAAVLYRNLRRQQGIDRPDRFLDWIDTSELADAVIAALGLRPEQGQRSNPDGPLWGRDNRHTVTRYVTEWITDET